jgi:ABC-type branched-subunit amino acid transport system permease subunit
VSVGGGRGGSARVLAALLILLPLAAIPYAWSPYTANQFALYLIYGLLAMSLGMLWGGAGIMSFGQTAFFGIGAYTYGVIGLNMIQVAQHTNLAFIGGVAAAALLAATVGYFMFYGRISDIYAGIITIALTLVLFTLFSATAGDEWVIGVARLGGFNGMFGQGRTGSEIANFQIPPVTLWLPGFASPFEFRIDRDAVSGYYLVLVVCVVVYAATRLLLGSRLGRVALAIRENEKRAETFGYDIRFYKFLMFTIAGAIAGVAGILFAGWGRFINPERFGLAFASATVVNVLLGGRTTLLGGFLGALIVGYLTSTLGELAPFSSVSGEHPLWMSFLMEAGRRIVSEAPLLVQGGVLVVIVLVLKDGIAPSLFRLLQRWERWVWWLLVPAVIAYLGERVACEQADLCLY